MVALAQLPDEAIDTRDIPELTDWDNAEIGKFYRPRKQMVTIRLDADILSWFRARNRKYQTAVNEVLRDYVTGRARKRDTRPANTKGPRRKSVRG